MRAVLHPLPAVDPEVKSAWSALAERAAEPNPFAEPLLALPAARHLGERGVVALLAVHLGGAMVAATPVVHRPAWRRVPWPTWSTFRHDYCFSGTPLLDADHLAEAAAALMEAAGRLHGCLVALEWLRLDGPVAAALGLTAEQTSEQRGIGPRAVLYEAFERPATRPGEGPSLAEARRRRFRRAAARLDGSGGDAPVPRERPADPDGVEAFLELERSGWKGRAGTAFACRSGHGAFLREVADGFRRAGRLRLVSMESGGRPVGMTLTLGGGSVEFGFKSAYDEGWRPAAPGIQVVAAAIEAAAAAGAAVDSCASPTERWLGEIMPERLPIGTFVLPPRGPAGVAPWAAVRALLEARDVRRGLRARCERGESNPQALAGAGT